MEGTVHENPFVGPRPFERSDASLFFGRRRERRQLLSLLIAYRTVLLYAVSGAGKTSLLNAALIPALEREEGFEVLPVARVRGMKADLALPSAPRNVYVFNALSHWVESPSGTRELGASTISRGQWPGWTTESSRALRRPVASHRRLTELSLAKFLSDRPHAVDTDGEPTPRAVIFDQFEELFSLHPEHWRHRADFLEQVAEALQEDDLLRVMFVMREEHLGEFDRYSSPLPYGLSRFRLERLGFDGALSAVNGPVSNTDRSFAPGVAESLVRDLMRSRVDVGTEEGVEYEGEFVEPVQLQVVCRTLWSDLPDNVTVIQSDHLRQLGNVDDVLSRFYSEAVTSASEKAHVSDRELRLWLEQHFITPGGTRNTVYATRHRTAGMPNSVMEELEAQHLIRAEWRAGARWYELTHDRLIGPIRASNRAALVEPVDLDDETDARRRANRALTRAEAAWLEGLSDQVKANQERAIQIYRSIGDLSAVADTLMRMAELFFRSEEFGRARELASEAHEIYQTLDDELGIADALRAMGRVDVRHKQTEEAVPRLTEALDIYQRHAQGPGAGWTLLLLAEALQLDGRHEQATSMAELGLKQFQRLGDRSGAASSLAMLGSLYVSARKLNDALKSYDAAREIHWQLADLVGASTMLAHVGYILCELDQYDQAIARFTEAIRLAPDETSLYAARGAARWYFERYDGAVADYGRVLDLAGDDAAAYAGRGNALVERLAVDSALAKRLVLDSALSDLNQALELTTDDRIRASARRGVGLALGLLGNYQQAMEEFAASLELAPDDAFTYYSRARILQLVGEHDQARGDFGRALKATDPPLSGPRRERAEAIRVNHESGTDTEGGDNCTLPTGGQGPA